jgi:hypothetical protein
VSTDAGLVERTLAFSGSYVSDDGNIRITRAHSDSFEYSGARFVGHCDVCARAGLLPPTGQLLADVAAADRFLATHDHGDVD